MCSSDLAKRPPESATPLFDVSADGKVTLIRAEAEKLFKLGTLTRAEFTSGVTETQSVTDAAGKTTDVTNTFAGRDGALYDKYVSAMRIKMDIELDTLKARIENMFTTSADIKESIARLLKTKTLAPDDVRFIDGIVKKYRDYIVEGLERDRKSTRLNSSH